MVVDDNGGTGSAASEFGHGLIGMRERVGLHNGRLFAGPTSSGWRVSAWLPLHDDQPGGRLTMTIRVVLADDEQLLRVGFRMILDAHDDFEVVAEAANGREAIAAAAAHQPEVVVMDVRMPELDGIAATEAITREHPDVRVLILTTFDLDEYAFAGLRAGASGFLLKNAPPDELVAAIRTVAAGDAVVAPRVTRRLLDTFAQRHAHRNAGGTRRAAGPTHRPRA